MRNSMPYSTAIMAATALCCLAGTPFDLTWNTIDGGGVMQSVSADGAVVLSGTIGQPDAGVMTGGDFKLSGGFWFETPPGDCNGNGVRDLGDHAGFVDCMAGPGNDILGGCECFDVDGSGTVDLADSSAIQRGFHGE